MSPDPFDRLAVALRTHTARIVGRPTRHFRARVVDIDPLEATSDDNLIYLHEDDDDVELSREIKRLMAAADLEAGDMVDVREDDEGFYIGGVIS